MARPEHIFDVTTAFDELAAGLAEREDPVRGQKMSAYFRNQFDCLGVSNSEVRAALATVLTTARSATADQIIAFANRCWAQDEREFQQAGAIVLRRRARVLNAEHLDDVKALITTRSWWDTVDPLAAWVVGPMVQENPRLTSQMDQWAGDTNLWLRRTAIIHQLQYKSRTDTSRLFAYCLQNADDRDFFIRKAIGWALRQYAKTDPDAVRRFVNSHDGWSGLTRREALKHLSDAP